MRPNAQCAGRKIGASYNNGSDVELNTAADSLSHTDVASLLRGRPTPANSQSVRLEWGQPSEKHRQAPDKAAAVAASAGQSRLQVAAESSAKEDRWAVAAKARRIAAAAKTAAYEQASLARTPRGELVRGLAWHAVLCFLAGLAAVMVTAVVFAMLLAIWILAAECWSICLPAAECATGDTPVPGKLRRH